VKEHPILMSAPMVRAILDGTKTQTRRAVKVQPPDALNDGRWYADRYNNGPQWCWWGKRGTDVEHKCAHHIGQTCPFGVVGDRLWVRETWAPDPRAPEVDGCAVYRATDEVTINAHGARVDRWRPSIHMPRWASRITLEVTEVRVQRLGDISEDDALAEGIRKVTKDGNVMKYCVYDASNDHSSTPWSEMRRSPQLAYMRLWDSINGEGASEVNPWVWAISFKRTP